MAKYILSDTRPRKKTNPVTLYIPEIPAPEKHAALYFDAHKDAPTGFVLKVSPAGRKTWLLCYYIKGREKRVTLDKGHPAWGPKRARIEASKLKTMIISGADILAEREAKKAAEREAEAAKLAKAHLTLGKLCEAYVEQLRRDGKTSARAVDNSLRKNIELAFPKHWATPAADIEVDDALEIVATLHDAGKLREAAKLRSYLRAAYTVAVRARTDAAATPAMRKFKLGSNPVSDLAPIVGNLQARDRALSLTELRKYYERITALPSPDGPILALQLLTGGQRLEQLFRLTDKDWDRDGDTITLYDNKGRRRQPRAHVLPLTQEVKDALKSIGDGPYLVSFDNGKSPATDSKFRSRFRAICAAMLKAEEATEAFTPGDIRRTVETRLAAAGVTSDVLAQLLSHGLGTIQQRHYQRHDFMAEKLAALVTLRDLLTTPSGDVVTMRRRAK